MLNINCNEMKAAAAELKAGDEITLSGTVYTARDAAHKLIARCLEKGERIPFPLCGSIIYYAGPTQTPDGAVCGSFGPTTSGRMDAFTPLMLSHGVCATIGKGGRSDEVTAAIVKYKSPYLVALGGAGALAASHITACEVVCFEALGCESVKKLCFDKFPLYVGTDIRGNSIYDLGGRH